MNDLQITPLITILIEGFRFSATAAQMLIEQYGELEVQRNAMYCLYLMDKGKVHSPPAWITASLKGEWGAPYDMPADWLPTVLHFRVDENTFIEFTRELRKQKENSNV